MTEIRKFDPTRVPRPRAGAVTGIDVRERPLDIEVGCGVGLHSIRYARENPDRQLIAIERTKTRFDKFAGRVQHHEPLKNLHPIHADAVGWITYFVAPLSVDRYFFLYPNPYPRTRDENKRWYAMPFMGQILATLKEGGTLTLATNEARYADRARDFMMKEWGLLLLESRELKRDDAPRTHFEKKYLERGEKCVDLVFLKPPAPKTAASPEARGSACRAGSDAR